MSPSIFGALGDIAQAAERATRNTDSAGVVRRHMSDEHRPRPSGGFNESVIDDFRSHRGQITKGPFTGRSLLLLTTRGAKSGRDRTNPLAYTRDGDRIVVIASKGGAPTNPDWYRNLRANPKVTLEVGPERFEARARVAKGAERRRLYDLQATHMPAFKEYERKTSREIPVVVLERAS
jgi:deazaflavin-dependent oxidoreductase (nitroreductase family)